MKLDITVCHSILEFCFNDGINLTDILQDKCDKLIVLEEIKKRRICLSDNLEEQYHNYFSQERPELLDIYQSFIGTLMGFANNIKFIDNQPAAHYFDFLENDSYLEVLCTICYLSEDQILLSNKLDSDQKIKLESMAISCFDIQRIQNMDEDNKLNLYRLPIIAKRIPAKIDNNSISTWLSKFLLTENEFTIVDRYIYQNSNSFLNYFLIHVQAGAKIKIYTVEGTQARRHDIYHKFNSQPFRNWDIEIYIIPNTRDQHARNILTNQYFIEIDNGMGLFGRDGLTYQGDITIQYKNQVHNHALPNAQLLSS
ncbi:hypothetical protein P4244_20470 [Bacillus thuringiensis]|nr:hypothetical protein [Bacillus thuringiensis]